MIRNLINRGATNWKDSYCNPFGQVRGNAIFVRRERAEIWCKRP